MSTNWINGATLEGQALVYCCHTNVSPSIVDRLEDLLSPSFDWERFKELAKFHGVIPLVSHSLQKLPSSCIADGILREFSSYVQASLVLKQLIVQEMLTIAKVFSEERIPVVPLKGPILALSIYDRLEFREFLDLDLMVKSNDIPRSREILLSLGYTRRQGQEVSKEGQESLYNNFTKKNGMFLIDLQHGLWGPSFYFSLDHDIFWKNLEKIRIQDQELLCFSPEILLILLCLHGNKHVWEYGKWICDIAELLRKKPNLNWARVNDLSREMGCWRQVLMGVCLAEQIFGISLPSDIHKDIQNDSDIISLSQGIPYSLIQDSHKKVYEKHREAFFLSLKESNWERLSYALQMCANKSPVIENPLSWFRFQKKLQVLNYLFVFLSAVLSNKKLKKFIHAKLFPSKT